jgi:hypothetical protein
MVKIETNFEKTETGANQSTSTNQTNQKPSGLITTLGQLNADGPLTNPN